MHKDRVILLLLVAMFGLASACDLPWESDDEEIRLPDRAAAATGLLRHYYDTRTFPRKMTPIKIPEGNSFDERQLTVEMPMGGNVVVDQVRVRLYIIPPPGYDGSQVVDLMTRVIAPDGTTSSWKMVDFLLDISAGDADYFVDSAAEVIFLNDFKDTGSPVMSDGLWRIQLRDPIDDGDGRCVFRNATLRINDALVPGIPNSGNQTSTLALNEGPYEERLPFHRGIRSFGDIGTFGFNAPLRMDFEFTDTFQVHGYALTFTLRVRPDLDPEDEVYIAMITPSGGWVIGMLPDPVETDTLGGEFADRYFTYVIAESAVSPYIDSSFRFLGEPSAGTWHILLWTVRKDNLGYYLSKDQVVAGLLTLDQPATLNLQGA
jgi:hypothetical protein